MHLFKIPVVFQIKFQKYFLFDIRSKMFFSTLNEYVKAFHIRRELGSGAHKYFFNDGKKFNVPIPNIYTFHM